MIFWSSWGRIIKELTKEILWPLILFLEIGLFWYFRALGPGALNTLFATVLFLSSLYFYIKRREESLEFLVFLIIFLGFSVLYNLQFAFSLPLWLAGLCVFVYNFLIFVYFSNETPLYSSNSLIFNIALSICILEVFYILFFWPTNPISKSFILTSLFYAFWFIVVKKEKILTYTILVCATLILVIATTKWPVI